MANPSKTKGTRAETRVARYLSEHGLPSERKPLAGSADKGDLRMTIPSGAEVTIEVKAGRQTDGYTRSQLRKWQEQTVAEMANSGCPAVLVIVRYRRSIADAEVWTGVYDGLWRMMYLDDFVKMIGGPYAP